MMKIRKNSEAYKNGIRYSPNIDTLAANAERASNLLGVDYQKEHFPVSDEICNLRRKLPPDTLEPIEKKLEW